MANDVVLALVLGVIFGCVFFIVDIYNENKTKEINTSLIAGITITYFFIILLPEINSGLEELPFGLYKFIGILIGFSFIHLTEKFILLRVEQKSQLKLKDIFKEEADVIEKEKKAEKSLINKLVENNKDNLTVENLVEKLYALEEINKIQEIWSKEEERLKEKLMKADLEILSYLNILSATKKVGKVIRLCAVEEMILENSLMENLLDINQENPTYNLLATKLQAIAEIRQKQIETAVKAEDLITYLITSLMADKRDKITKKEFLEKLLELDSLHKILESCLVEERKLGKIKIEDPSGHLSEKRASKNLYALEVLRKIQEACIVEEKNLQSELMEIGHNRLSLLSKFSALKEISKIRMICVEEEKNLEKKLIKKDQDIFSKKDLTEKFNALKKISNVKEETLLKERILMNSLIRKLMKNDENNRLSINELSEKIAELGELHKIQEDIVEQEKNIEKSMIFNISRDENERFSLQELAMKLDTFCHREEELEMQDYTLKVKIQNRINEHLDELHGYTNFVFHLLIGIILFELLTYDFITAVLFFVFALFKALTSKTSNDIQLFPGIEISAEHNEPLYLKIIGASAALIGIFIGVILNVVFHLPLDIIFMLFSFISGVILYTIIREVLPENESGRPLYFLLGIIIFLIVIIAFQSVFSLFTPP
jgi:zinc transporter ZupT